jgi:hypothetical protein
MRRRFMNKRQRSHSQFNFIGSIEDWMDPSNNQKPIDRWCYVINVPIDARSAQQHFIHLRLPHMHTNFIPCNQMETHIMTLDKFGTGKFGYVETTYTHIGYMNMEISF